MPVRIQVEHVSQGWLDVFKSDGMQAAVDEAGRGIARRACAAHDTSFEPFRYYPKPGNFTAMGFVSSTGPTGAAYEATDKSLTKAVNGG